MASKKKMNKLKNSFSVPGWLKNKKIKLKRTGFYNASLRKVLKQVKED